MQFIIRRPWQLSQRDHTPEAVYLRQKLHRRQFLASLGVSAAGIGALLLQGCDKGTDDEVLKAGNYEPIPTAPAADANGEPGHEPIVGDSVAPQGMYPARRNDKFEYGRAETVEAQAARYTNFYEFDSSKMSWRYVTKFQPSPWTVEVDGLCAKPRTFDLDDLHKLMPLEERAYRHRCVETWAMCVPWTGFRLSELLKLVEPQPAAKFVAFETFDRPSQAPHRGASPPPSYPWPYTEGLTIAEATNELTLLATGMYGHTLLKQHGAPVRLVVPWKYGFKSIKSIVRITLADKPPATFWNTLMPDEYDFEANVNPHVSHPRWSQRVEKMLGSGEKHPTVIYNGYGSYVADLYPKA
ncbi:MAG: protein-methionine-sulfoxide reductase catalytic subunit MsrP [Planctomycetaceae bacterium]|nr:protein-methionine-sulfoxide reductase catalytic subunit MsrP [Planctomycetaceae bacterium]